MKHNLTKTVCALFLLVCTSVGYTQTTPAYSDAYTGPLMHGIMNIDYGSRQNLDPDGRVLPDPNGKDIYKFALRVCTTTVMAGTIEAQQTITKWGRVNQQGYMKFSVVGGLYPKAGPEPVNMSLMREYAEWGGYVKAEKDGSYHLGGIKDAENRVQLLAIGDQNATYSSYSGVLQGKAPKSADWKSQANVFWKTTISGQEKEIPIAQPDPITFNPGTTLAAFPKSTYPECGVTGAMIYDRKSGNYFINDLTFTYNVDGKAETHTLSGNIKWWEDPNRATNGIGAYIFNIKCDAKAYANVGTHDDAAAMAAKKMSDEDAMDFKDNNPHIDGRINYVDSQFVNVYDTVDKTTTPSPRLSAVTYMVEATNIPKVVGVKFSQVFILAAQPLNAE